MQRDIARSGESSLSHLKITLKMLKQLPSSQAATKNKKNPFDNTNKK